jgi:uncharacterized protein
MTIEAELIRRLFVIIDAQKWGSLDEVFTIDVEYYRPGYPPINSIGDLRSFYEKTRRISAGRHTLCDVVADGVKGCCWGHFDGLGKSGEIISEDFAEWYEFSDSLIAVRRTFFFRPAV